MHDPRIGRFFASDPLASKYPHNSPYAFSENVVINAVELEGLERKTIIYRYDPQLGHYPAVPITIDLAYGSGWVMRWEGGPLVPDGYDTREIYYTDSDREIADLSSKDFSRVWHETKKVVKITNTTSAKIKVDIDGRVFNAEAKLEAQVNKVEVTIDEDGNVSSKTSGPKASYEVGGGMFGVTGTLGEDSEGSETAKVKVGGVTLSGTNKEDGTANQSLLYTKTISEQKGAGVTNETTISVGFEHKGNISTTTENAMKQNNKEQNENE